MGTAAIKTVEMDQALAGLPVQHREIQSHESSLFLSYFPDGIRYSAIYANKKGTMKNLKKWWKIHRYLSGGYESGYHHVEDMLKDWKPRLFHCKGKRNVRCTQVRTVLQLPLVYEIDDLLSQSLSKLHSGMFLERKCDFKFLLQDPSNCWTTSHWDFEVWGLNCLMNQGRGVTE